MTHGKTQFQKTWLGKTDRNGHLIGQTLEEDPTPYTIHSDMHIVFFFL